MISMDMNSMAASIGVSVAVLRFLLCFVATIPVSFFWRIVPSRLGKHIYAAASGVFLSYLSFGFSSNLHFLVPMTIGYASMAMYRPKCGIITFFLGFAYLIGCHVFYMSGDAWKEGGIDSTGALMVLTLKVISCAVNYNDGMLKEEGLREAQKKNRLIEMPSLIEYFGYCLCCGSHFAGPVYEMKDYLQWTEGTGIWDSSEKRKQPSPYLATLRAIFQAGICMALYLYLVPQFPLTRFTEPVYQEWGFWKKFGYQYMAGQTARWKYYFIWSISEASIIISGLGFSGWTDDDASPKPKWDRAKNVDILGVELAKSAGLYPGYMMFFVQSALMIAGSRVIYRWQQAISPKLAILRSIMVFINFLYTVLVLNYSAVGFMVLSLHETLTAYGSVYYIGTIIPVGLILLSYVVPAKPSRPKPRKEE
ncbi:hypothetical protein F2Q69_00026504 [Brassica cretica]|uniref:1-acylglycerophosphocholine O-acyltransferase n=1 Tax=Brassica cretica TaxID=69181 RepID=A0A8S9S2H1_BRACR|nr:hypothetical protein F2Q69_00026504 [Brassica cretica]